MTGPMDLASLIAIDVHTHAEVSCRQEPDEAWKPYEEASAKYFKAGSKRPTIAETVAYYRERKIGLAYFNNSAPRIFKYEALLKAVD